MIHDGSNNGHCNGNGQHCNGESSETTEYPKEEKEVNITEETREAESDSLYILLYSKSNFPIKLAINPNKQLVSVIM